MFGFFFKSSLSFPPPPKKHRAAGLGRVPALAEPWWAPAAARIPVGDVSSEILGGRHMPASLLTVHHGLAETKPPSFLLRANREDEKSPLKVFCNKQRGLLVPDSCERRQRIFGVKTMLVQNVAPGLGKKLFLGRGWEQAGSSPQPGENS